MSGEELRQKLQCQEMPLRQIAIAMGITEQDFQSKLKAKDLKVSFVISVSKATNKSVYALIDDEVSNTLPLMGDKEAILPTKKNLIPFYDDVSTIGGLNDRGPTRIPVPPPSGLMLATGFPKRLLLYGIMAIVWWNIPVALSWL